MQKEKSKLQEAREALAAVENESDSRIAAARAILADMSPRNWKRDEAQAELDSLLRIREIALKRAHENVTIAEAEYQSAEKAQEAKESAIADEKEKKMYDEALRRYVESGGRRDDFPEAWKAIREQLLNAAVVRGVSVLGKQGKTHVRF